MARAPSKTLPSSGTIPTITTLHRAAPCARATTKLIEYYEDGMLELYNLRDDLGESKNLARQLPEKTWELQRILDAWRKSVDARMPTLNPVHDPAKAGFLSQEGVRQDPPEAREGGKPQGK